MTRKRIMATLAIIALLVSLLPAAALAYEETYTFTSDDTLVIPAGVESMTVTAYGGGGGGGGGFYYFKVRDSRHYTGGNGFNGSAVSEQVVAIDQADWGASLSIVVGQGGTGGIGGHKYTRVGPNDPGQHGQPGGDSTITVGSDLTPVVAAAGGAGGGRATKNGNGSPSGTPDTSVPGAGGAGGTGEGPIVGELSYIWNMIQQADIARSGQDGCDGSVTITFTFLEYDLTVSTVGDGEGDVQVWNWDTETFLGLEGTYTFTYGTEVKLIAAPDEPCSVFDGWAGDVASGDENDTEIFVTMDEPKTLTAGFNLNTIVVEVNSEEGGHVVVAPGYDNGEIIVEAGQTATVAVPCCDYRLDLTAVPENGWLFSHWEFGGGVSPSGLIFSSNEVTIARLETIEMPSEPFADNPALFDVCCYAESPWVTALFVEEPGGEGSITVNVVKSDGGDVSGVAVSFGGDLSATIHTDASGVAKINGLWAGNYTVDASATGYTSNGPKDVELADDDSDESVTITLTPTPPAPPEPGPGAIEGKAEDGNTAAGLPGVLVKLLDSSDTIVGMTMSDPDGDFAFPGLEPGEYEVRGTLSDYGSDSAGAVVVNDATTEVVLELAAVIVVPPTPPAAEPEVTPPDLPKTGADLTGLFILSGLVLAAGAVARRRGY